jgi:hypothetical protein
MILLLVPITVEANLDTTLTDWLCFVTLDLSNPEYTQQLVQANISRVLQCHRVLTCRSCSLSLTCGGIVYSFLVPCLYPWLSPCAPAVALYWSYPSSLYAGGTRLSMQNEWSKFSSRYEYVGEMQALFKLGRGL